MFISYVFAALRTSSIKHNFHFSFVMKHNGSYDNVTSTKYVTRTVINKIKYSYKIEFTVREYAHIMLRFIFVTIIKNISLATNDNNLQFGGVEGQVVRHHGQFAARAVHHRTQTHALLGTLYIYHTGSRIACSVNFCAYNVTTP